MATGDQDIRQSLARAFDRAWDGYYRSNKQTLSLDVARTELAKRIVQLSKEGVQDERLLAKAGLRHLQERRGTRLTRNLDRWNRLDDANNAEGENLAGYQEDGEVNPHLLSSADGLSSKLAGFC